MGELTDDSGWKQVRGDVFRAPPHLILYSALLGTGYQLLFLIFFIILLALAADFYEEYVYVYISIRVND
jgi:transmembrane 9 superfamily protein 3